MWGVIPVHGYCVGCYALLKSLRGKYRCGRYGKALELRTIDPEGRKAVVLPCGKCKAAEHSK